jgi:hypothetical protein
MQDDMEDVDMMADQQDMMDMDDAGSQGKSSGKGDKEEKPIKKPFLCPCVAPNCCTPSDELIE